MKEINATFTERQNLMKHQNKVKQDPAFPLCCLSKWSSQELFARLIPYGNFFAWYFSKTKEGDQAKKTGHFESLFTVSLILAQLPPVKIFLYFTNQRIKLIQLFISQFVNIVRCHLVSSKIW